MWSSIRAVIARGIFFCSPRQGTFPNSTGLDHADYAPHLRADARPVALLGRAILINKPIRRVRWFVKSLVLLPCSRSGFIGWHRRSLQTRRHAASRTVWFFSCSLAAVTTALCFSALRLSTAMCRLIPKYCSPFSVRCISGSPAFPAFLVELRAPIMVASTIVPTLNLKAYVLQHFSHLRKQHFTELVAIEKAAKLEQRHGIGTGLAANINAQEATQAGAVVEGLLIGQICWVESLPKHPRQTNGQTIIARFGAVGFDDFTLG